MYAKAICYHGQYLFFTLNPFLHYVKQFENRNSIKFSNTVINLFFIGGNFKIIEFVMFLIE